MASIHYEVTILEKTFKIQNLQNEYFVKQMKKVRQFEKSLGH